MKDLVYLSRAFVEFGPFAKNEIRDFQKRGLLTETDYLRTEGSENWVHYQEWLIEASKSEAKTEPKLEPKPTTKPAAKAEKAPLAAKAPAAKKGTKAK